MFQTEKRDVFRAWNEVQRIQTDIAYPAEKAVYYLSPRWLGGPARVLDIGCGNGYYLSRLAADFPWHGYQGIDISPEFIAEARRTGPAGACFAVGDVLEPQPEADAIVARLLFQHLEIDEVGRALEACRASLAPGGELFVIDSHDRYRVMHPALPGLNRLIGDYKAAKLSEERRDRDVCDRIAALAQASPGWELATDGAVIASTATHVAVGDFATMYGLWTDVLFHDWSSAIDAGGLKAEIRDWAARTDAYAQVGIRIMRLVRTG